MHKLKFGFPCFLLATLILGFSGCSSVRKEQADILAATQVQAELKRISASPSGKDLRLANPKRVQALYADREYRPLWVAHTLKHGQIPVLMEYLGKAEHEGLPKGKYHVDTLIALLGKIPKTAKFWAKDSVHAARTEILLTDAWLTYANHLLNGWASTSRFEIIGEIHAEKEPLDTLLYQALEKRSLETTIEKLFPEHEHYSRLREELAELRSQAKESAEGSAFADTGMDLQTRIRSLEMTLERWRWLPRSLGEKHILVNIPDYRLELRDKGKLALEMKVVAGKFETQTPFMSDTLTYIVLNPYWFVPSSIVREELAVKIRADKGFFQTTDYEMVDPGTAGEDSAERLDPDSVDWSELPDSGQLPFTIRQRPGPKNALGRVKFLFPNRFSIYLHDTPNQEGFQRDVREGSHGCVRVEFPVELAEKVLRGQDELKGDSLRSAIAGGARRHIRLDHPLPVHLVYFTAIVDESGKIRYRKDSYGWDAAMRSELNPK